MQISIHWPQFILLVWMLLGLIAAIQQHGKTGYEKYSATPILVDIVATLIVLYWGGFFG